MTTEATIRGTISGTPRFLLITATPNVTSERNQRVLRERTERLEAVAKEAVDEIRKLGSDPERTRKGRKKAVAAAADEWGRKLRADGLQANAIEHFRGEVESAREKALNPRRRLRLDSTLEPAVVELRQQEIRRELKVALESAQVEGVTPAIFLRQKLSEAAKADDKWLLAAVENAPQSFPVADEDVLAEIAELHSRQLFPAEWDEIDDTAAMVGMLENNRSRVIEEARKVGISIERGPGVGQD